MKRVYLSVAVLALLLAVGKLVLSPSSATASLGSPAALGPSAEILGDLTTFNRPSKLSSASLPGQGELSEDDPSAEPASKASQVLPGLVVPSKRAAVRAAVSGMIRELSVSEGASVAAGQVVGHVNEGEVLAELERQTACIASAESRATEAEALADLAAHNHRLNRQLSQRQVVTAAEVVESGFRAKAGAAKLATLQRGVVVARREKAVTQQRLVNYRMVAPFSGHVTEILRYRNQYVGQGDVILWIESHEKQLRLHLPAELIEQCAGLVDRLEVSVLLPKGRWLDVKVHAAKSHRNPDGSRTILFTIGPEETLLAGQIADTKVTLREEKP